MLPTPLLPIKLRVLFSPHAIWFVFVIILSTGITLIPGSQVFSQQSTTYYISPSGSDSNPGTFEMPFATLEGARNAIRHVNTDMQADIIVYLQGGIYWLDTPISLLPQDSGNNGYSVVYQAYQDETPVISGGKLVEGWALYDPDKNIYRSSLSIDFETRQLYVNGVRAVRARSDDNPPDFTKTSTGYSVSGNEMAQWGNISDIEFVYQQEWKTYRCGVANITDHSVSMKEPCFTNAQRVAFTNIDSPLWIENAYELLDSGGEWYLDSKTGSLYYKPRPGENMATAVVVAPKLETILTGHGTLAEPIHNLKFIGLTFAESTWLAPSNDDGFVEVQANYAHVGGDTFSSQIVPAQINFVAARSVKFEGNTFTRLGAAGLAFEIGSQNNSIVGNRFYDISGVAIRVGGVTSNDHLNANAIVRDNLIANNLIHHIGLEYFGAPAVVVGYADGTLISHNEIAELPYSGISVGWGWGNGESGASASYYSPSASRYNRIQYNYIHDFMKVLRDGGGIYTLGSQFRSLISDNYIANQQDRYGAIYLDEGTQGYSVVNNVIALAPYWLNTNTRSINNIAYNNFTVADARLINPNSKIEILQTNVHADGDWPAAAASIIANSGLEAAYEYLENGYDYQNLVTDKPLVTASSNRSDFLAQFGNDGDANSRWQSSAGDNYPWWEIDLGYACYIDRVELIANNDDPKLAHRRNFEVRASNKSDFSDFVVLASQGATAFANQKPWVASTVSSQPYRYLRIVKTVAEDFSFSEVRAWNSISHRFCNAAVGAPAQASSEFNQQFGAAKGNDGDLNVGWSPASANVDPQSWWQVDLGASYKISTIEFVTRQDLDQSSTRQDFSIWGSNDCTFSGYVELGGRGSNPLSYLGTWVINPDTLQTFRYLRVFKTVPDYFFIGELQVWHDSATPALKIVSQQNQDCGQPRF